ncbi:uncharacterized protein [Magallana gigas]|uniref:uncharacterized protein n=1 Tax=Magallana gigas TaxID=29159 RepID=UPI003341BA03
MESDMCISMLKNLESNDVCVGTIIMDNDSTTISKARSEVKADLKKQCDRNHLLKDFTNKLYDIRKAKNFRELTPKTISHISKCFRYCVSQNQEDTEKMKKNLLALGKHVFGDHSYCGSWCGYLQNPLKYKPKHLPYSRYLCDEKLKITLMDLLHKYSSDADKLTHLGSSQANESLNNAISSKAPKTNFFSGSESNDYRVAAAIAQKNIGYGYVTDVCQSVMLSPGEITKKISEEYDRKREKARERESTIQFKKRRREKKEQQSNHQKTCEVREGKSYETAVDMNNNICSDDICEIPPPQTEQTCKELIPGVEYAYVSFDLETTGLGNDSEITQIGAAYIHDKSYSQYLLPSKRISTSAIALTGLTVAGSQMYKEGEPVPSTSTSEGLTNFLQWLSSIHKPVVLVAHNARFDANAFCRALITNDMNGDAGKVIQGFVDTLSLFRKERPGLCSYKQTDLVKSFIQTDYNAHDAASDAKALLQLLTSQNFSEHILLQHSFSFDSYISLLNYHEMVQKNSSSLMCLVNNKVISKMIMTRIAKSGLSFSHLLLAYKRDSQHGVLRLLSENTCEGKPRVTSNKKIIGNLCSYIKDVCD